ncbi:MAG TPA: glycosyltransferase [Gemmatimonadales bacterium]|jgi:cellulose synthase/poly-beta-1,6-N-acetylglucosamine synthase-like glycosyltransferase
MSDTVLRFLVATALAAQPLFITFFLLHNTYTLALIVLSARQVRRRVTSHFVEDLDLIDTSDLTKPLTMIIPAYNEEVTIVDSVTSLVNCEYPRFEIVVVNDGSTDRTLERLREAFGLRVAELPYRAAIATAPVRAMYEATIALPRSAIRVAVIDKQNGGKADALNAGINASTAPYIVSLDADSILDEHALKELMRVVQEDPRVVAVGGQVAIANGCTVRHSRVTEVRLPTRPLARFQMVEYLRSFTTGRTGLDRLESVLILSGVFAVFEKATLIRAGGYLTPFVRHRIVEEYVGTGAGTVCEDMEIVVRLHRYVRDKGLDRRIAFLPHPVAWTEVPETLESLRKQRGRWYRGLRESLRYHRGMLGRRPFGRIGWFALPAFWLFEYLGPLVEVTGYVLVLFLFIVERTVGGRLIDPAFLWAFLLASLGYGTLVNVAAVLVGAWRFRAGLADHLQRRLLPFGGWREVLVLLGYAVMENFGFRQLTLYWRLRGLWDAWRGKKGWEKFARVGFRRNAAAARA